MLISYKNKFIFIHNPKVAGLSIKRVLGKHALNSPSTFDRLNAVTENISILRVANFYVFSSLPFLDNYGFHSTAENLRLKIGKNTWGRYYKFGFVRNPWDREVSLYYYILNKPKHYLNKQFIKLGSFDEYVRWNVDQPTVLQKKYFFSSENTLLVDFIGTFENINADFHNVCVNIGLDLELPHVNISKRQKSYRDYYTKESMKLVYDKYIEDIEQFGYEF